MMSRRTIRSLFPLIWLFCGLFAQPLQAALQLQEANPPQPLAAHVEVLTDPRGQLQLHELLTGNHPFAPPSGGNLNFGYVQGAVWLRLEVQSAQAQPGNWRLAFSYPSLDRIELYDIGSDGIRLSQAGDMLPFEQRSVGNRTPVFDIRLQPGEKRTLYLRATSEGTMTLDSALYPRHQHERHSIDGYLVHAMYAGTLLALACYNLLLFFALRERPFLYYALFVSAFFVGILGLNGLGAQFLWSGAGWWTNRALPFGINAAAAIGLLFARSFLDTAKWMPRGDRWLRLATILLAGCALATLLLPVQQALQLMSISGLCMCLCTLITGFICVRRGAPGAALFLLAWLTLLLGASLLALRNFALIPSNAFTMHAMQIGSALEMILLSLALAARFNEIKRQKEQVLQSHERQLEHRVAERTEALEQANRQLSSMAMQDALTQLANRTSLQSQLDQAIQRAKRRNETLAVMLIDLDGFKPINDLHGHELGDRVLVEIARRLRECARDSDLPARLGGDEFVLVCEAIDSAEHALEVAERILTGLHAPILLGELCLQVGASIGIVLSRGDESGTALIRQADAAMYAAKAAGRNRVMLAQARHG